MHLPGPEFGDPQGVHRLRGGVSAYGTQLVVKDEMWAKHGHSMGCVCLDGFEAGRASGIRLEALGPGMGKNLIVSCIEGKGMEGNTKAGGLNPAFSAIIN